MTPCLDRPSLSAQDLAVLDQYVEARPSVLQARERLDRALARHAQDPTPAREDAVVGARRLWEHAVRVEAGLLYDRLWG